MQFVGSQQRRLFHVEFFDEFERRKNHDAARTRRRHQINFVAGVFRGEGSEPTHFVFLEVFEAESAARFLGRAHDILGDRSLIKAIEIARAERDQRPGQAGLAQNFAGFERGVFLGEGLAAGGVEAVQSFIRFAGPLSGNGKAVARQPNRAREQVGPFEFAVFLMECPKARGKSGHRDRVPPVLRRAFRQCLVVIATGHRGRDFAEVDGFDRAVHLDKGKAAPAQRRVVGRSHAQGQADRDRDVDDVPAFARDLAADVDGVFARRRNHQAVAAGRNGEGGVMKKDRGHEGNEYAHRILLERPRHLINDLREQPW